METDGPEIGYETAEIQRASALLKQSLEAKAKVNRAAHQFPAAGFVLQYDLAIPSNERWTPHASCLTLNSLHQ
ncbi:hypothetical protein RRG08_012939 [Elysia crispata]|uniref:Uncharacterized protein n=1 Tax=Elysia crispata TaxID=231223 RepID=A0AAE1DQL9_9GAST|nr:hypothetical protein RRG08_012939 [Elysia crispata]